MLREQGIELTLSPFLDASGFERMYSTGGAIGNATLATTSLLRRIAQTFQAGGYDLLFVQREAMPFGPGFFEWLYASIGRMPVVLDLDDATYVRYMSPTYGRLGSFFKFFGKTDKLIDRAALVICGNRFIADYVASRGGQSVVIPTVVDENLFSPGEHDNEVPVLGWIGTHSTFQFLETLLPILEPLAEKHRFKLRIVGAGRDDVSVKDVEVENERWSLEREVSDFRDIDIGLYPISTRGDLDPQWIAGKSGFKAVQYMAVGVPFIMTPVGTCAEMGVPGETHFNASSPDDWYTYLDRLLADRDLRIKMGAAGRRHCLEHYSLRKQAEILGSALMQVRSDATAGQ
jgi:glycosyltransferase involved in cell wall biosynthesis